MSIKLVYKINLIETRNSIYRFHLNDFFFTFRVCPDPQTEHVAIPIESSFPQPSGKQ